MSFNPEKYDPVKYQKQASSYNEMISGITSSLQEASGELSNAENMLGFSRGNNDLLTSKVISSTTAAKSQIAELSDRLSNYSSLIGGKANTLDEEAKAEYEKWLREQENNNNNNNSNNRIGSFITKTTKNTPNPSDNKVGKGISGVKSIMMTK